MESRRRAARLRVLDRVGNDVGEHLFEPNRVAIDPCGLGVDLDGRSSRGSHVNVATAVRTASAMAIIRRCNRIFPETMRSTSSRC
jgi:hypothetical protein